MAKARVTWSGPVQVVQLPEEITISGSEVDVVRQGDQVILTDRKHNYVGLERAFELLAQLPPEIEERDDRPPQERDW